ncbi:Insulin gene enhancer protein ISL-1 [Frankliniella fusca]|uniref:Insulin gene enhancer protein ISL-1 n=1 Tax=Frankliniella fusca TaxID=407009 RepID=A0AAE1LML2_9NEOP|nr:Insulin gene enhancer protein ISL-1 [Frankliniella fusca]
MYDSAVNCHQFSHSFTDETTGSPLHLSQSAEENSACGASDGRKLGYGSMQGIPMVASSPVRHESPLGMNPIEVQSYQPPWKALSDFALHTDLERLDPTTPPFQHLVNQCRPVVKMHGYDVHGGPPLHGPPLGHAPVPGGAAPPPGPGPHPLGPGPGPHGPLSADMAHPDSTDSYVTYLESDDSLGHHEAPSPLQRQERTRALRISAGEEARMF